MTTTISEEVEAVYLSTQEDANGQVDSVSPLRWCLSRPAVERLRHLGIKNPFILIVIENKGTELERYLIPAEKLMTYIRFSRPGANIIHATVVWSSSPHVNIETHFLSRNESGFVTPVLEGRWPRAEALRVELEPLYKRRQRLSQEMAEHRDSFFEEHDRAAREASAAGAPARYLCGQVHRFRGELANTNFPLDSLESATDVASRVLADLATLEEALNREIEETSVEYQAPPYAPDEELAAEFEDVITRITEIEDELQDALKEPAIEYKVTDLGHDVGHIESEGQLQVNVPKALFGQSWRITKWLASRYNWSTPPRDQCHLRQRATATCVSAFVALPAAAILSAMNLVIALTLLFGGKRGVNFAPIRHPLRDTPRDVWRDADPSRWYKKQIGTTTSGKPVYVRQPLALRVINPVTVLPVAVILLVLNLFFGNKVAESKSIWDYIVPGIGGALAATLVIWGLLRAYRRFNAWRRKANSSATTEKSRREAAEQRRRQEEANRKRREAEQREREAFAATLTSLSCTAGQGEASLAALPRDRRTISLRAQAGKARVCKPLPR